MNNNENNLGIFVPKQSSLKVICEAPAQYTERGKKTLMLRCLCSLCGNIRDYRKTRVTTWKTISCGCGKLREIKPWDTFRDLAVLIEAPRANTLAKWRQLYVLCKCWHKYIIPIASWWVLKNCWRPNFHIGLK